MIIKFEYEDLKKLIYWIACKFKEDEFHHQSASVKRDLIGGFFDRWFNRAPEFLIFRELLKHKNYDVVIDNFLYGQDTKKNAPDVIGLRDSNGSTLVKFTLFRNGEWIKVDDMPYIEVKTFRNTQSLTSVAESQMHDDNYYVFVESHVREDYLTSLFEDAVYSNEIFESLKVSPDFIQSDSHNQIITPEPLTFSKELGHFELMGIFRGSEVMKYSLLVGSVNNKPQKPKYFDSIEIIGPISHSVEENISETVYKYGDNYIPFGIKFIQDDAKVTLAKRLVSYLVVKIDGKVSINGHLVENCYAKILFKQFDRSSKKKEYIGDKYVFKHFTNDVTHELIEIFDELTESVR